MNRTETLVALLPKEEERKKKTKNCKKRNKKKQSSKNFKNHLLQTIKGLDQKHFRKPPFIFEEKTDKGKKKRSLALTTTKVREKRRKKIKEQ